jgi:DNA invertase Pin-like site-specific DNA recombinase/ssDNA-binding Zn-finger/Zn-ribbon topoisomerase 1
MKKWKIAAYLRLSSDDGDKTESNSIGNQRNIIKQFINNNEFNSSVNYYIDDGYSGTTFERPDFNKMLNDIKDNKINCIIVKDLSRLGRNYIEVGKYIDEIFPSYNIRFIAINDNVDTYKDPKSTSNVIVPFKNLMNDEYARDISNKVRSVLDNKKEQGKFIGSYAPYGYQRDPNDKYKFIIDKEPAKVIKKIFSMILSGKSKKEIVNELNSLQIPTPRVYKLESGITNYEIKDSTKLWNCKKLDEILKNKTYTGDLIQGVRRKVSHKVHKNNRVNNEEWIISPNHHKGIISLEDFNKVQELLYERNIRINNKNNYDVFSGYLRCSKCGSNMIIRKGQYHTYYYCKNYLKDKSCIVKSIQKEKLEKLVIDFINNFRNVVIEIDKKIEMIVSQKEISYDIDIIKSKINKIDVEIDKYVKLRNEIKEDLIQKFISENEYWEYSADYSKKISEYKKEKLKLEDRLEKISFETENNTNWIDEIKKLKEVKKIDRLLIDELIEDIVVDENQNIKIIFKCEDKYFEALDFINRQNYVIM